MTFEDALTIKLNDQVFCVISNEFQVAIQVARVQKSGLSRGLGWGGAGSLIPEREDQRRVSFVLYTAEFDYNPHTKTEEQRTFGHEFVFRMNERHEAYAWAIVLAEKRRVHWAETVRSLRGHQGLG